MEALFCVLIHGGDGYYILMELKANQVYVFPDGREFVARPNPRGGYLLHDLRLGVASAPVYSVDPAGRILSWGKRTRWQVADLRATGRVSLPESQRLTLR